MFNDFPKQLLAVGVLVVLVRASGSERRSAGHSADQLLCAGAVLCEGRVAPVYEMVAECIFSQKKQICSKIIIMSANWLLYIIIHPTRSSNIRRPTADRVIRRVGTSSGHRYTCLPVSGGWGLGQGGAAGDELSMVSVQSPSIPPNPVQSPSIPFNPGIIVFSYAATS